MKNNGIFYNLLYNLPLAFVILPDFVILNFFLQSDSQVALTISSCTVHVLRASGITLVMCNAAKFSFHQTSRLKIYITWSVAVDLKLLGCGSTTW